jgi:hypothetical protein
LEEEVEGSNDGGSALVACTSRAISNLLVDQKPIVKKDKKKDCATIARKLGIRQGTTRKRRMT